MTLSATDRAALLDTLAPQLDGIVTRTVERARADLLAYAEVAPAELREGIAADLGRALAALVEQRELSQADRLGLSRIGDARARDGIPLEAMLQVYRLTIDEIFAALWSASERGLVAPDLVVRLTRLIWQYADGIMEVAIQAYRRRERSHDLARRAHHTAQVHGVLLGRGGTPDPALVGGLDPRAEYVAIRARRPGAQHELLLDLSMPGALDGGAAAAHEGDVIAYARRQPALGPSPGEIIGVGPAVTPDRLPHSLAIASRAVETAETFGRRGIVTLPDLAFEAISTAEHTIGDDLIRRYVLPCEPETTAGRELLDTVQAYLAHEQSVERAAGALFVHPNTVRNRLRRFEQLTSSNLRSVTDLCDLRLALLRATAGSC